MPTVRGKKKLQKYCRIFQWVEDKNEDLATAIRDLCMEGALSARRGNGTTFILPTEAVIKKICEATYGPNPEEAVALIEGHIIPDIVRTAADFNSGQGSRLGIKLEVKSTSGEKVTLAGGAVLVIASDFRPLIKDKIAVWVAESGDVPLTGSPFVKKSPAPATKRGRSVVRGGRPEGDPHASGSKRMDLTIKLETAFKACIQQKLCKSTHNTYLTLMIQLMAHLKDTDESLYSSIGPMLSKSPIVSWYLIVEPYKKPNTGSYMIPDSVFDMIKVPELNPIDVDSEMNTYLNHLEESMKGGVFKNASDEYKPVVSAEARQNATDGLRMQIFDSPSVIDVRREYIAAYQSFVSESKINDTRPIWPEGSIGLLNRNEDGVYKKMWMDAMYCNLMQMVNKMWVEPGRGSPTPENSAERYHQEIVQFVRTNRGDNYEKEVTVLLPIMGASVDMGSEKKNFSADILCTNGFLYTSSSRTDGGWGEIPVVPFGCRGGGSEPESVVQDYETLDDCCTRRTTTHGVRDCIVKVVAKLLTDAKSLDSLPPEWKDLILGLATP